MTVQTEQEKFFVWFEKARSQGMKNFKPMFDLENIAEKFGGTLKWSNFEEGPDGIFPPHQYIDWTGVDVDHDAVKEYMYEGLNKFVAAMDNAVPFGFYDSRSQAARLESLAELFEDAAKAGKDSIAVGDPALAAADLREHFKFAPRSKQPKVDVRQFVQGLEQARDYGHLRVVEKLDSDHPTSAFDAEFDV